MDGVMRRGFTHLSSVAPTGALSYRNVGARSSERAFINGSDGRPTLLFYCQHAFGFGSLTRAFALATAFSKPFRVVFLNGGLLPDGLPIPKDIHLIDLPPLSIGNADQQPNGSDEQRRRTMIGDAIRRHRPAVLLVDTFPFGQQRCTVEILSMIRMVRRQPGRAAVVVSTVRDIVAANGPYRQRDDDRARWLADRYFDAVLVHGDAAFARIDESFSPARPLQIAVHHTGFVVPQREPEPPAIRGDHLMVFAGGGSVGAELLNTVMDARRLMAAAPAMHLVAGPYLPPSQWLALRQAIRQEPGVQIVRSERDMVAAMRRARASISQCGYSAAMEIIASRTPALVVPHRSANDRAQIERATRLAARGLVQRLDADRLDARSMARAIERLMGFEPSQAQFEMNGATVSAELLHRMYVAASTSTSTRSRSSIG
jgi:predicted glycosyltransferase